MTNFSINFFSPNIKQVPSDGVPFGEGMGGSRMAEGGWDSSETDISDMGMKI